MFKKTTTLFINKMVPKLVRLKLNYFGQNLKFNNHKSKLPKIIIIECFHMPKLVVNAPLCQT